MPKFSSAKRHRNKHIDLVAACYVSNFELQNNPRKVSFEGEEITADSVVDSSNSISDLSNDDGHEEHAPRLKRRKPSSCLADMVALQTPKPSSWQHQCREQGYKQPLHVEESTSCVSPIWGHFVDVVLGDEEGGDSRDRDEPSFANPNVTPHHPLQRKNRSMMAITKLPAGGLMQERARHEPYSSLSNKTSRQCITVTKKSLLQDSISTSVSRSSSFVLQDPAALSEALTRLQV